jgi:hypothetical protein
MKRADRHTLLLFITALSIFIMPGMREVSAQTNSQISSPENQKKEAPADTSGVDVVLLLDCSGKMKQIDPNNLRKPAAKLFISLLGQDDAISIIGFGDTVREIAPLTKNTLANRERLFNGVDNITAKEFNTDITGAVRKAYDNLKPSSRANRVIVLMSNGALDVGSTAGNEKAYQELKAMLPEMAQAGIKIYSIYFSEFADINLLTEAATATNGVSALAKSDKDLHVIFTSVFEKIKSPDALPLQGDGFLVDKNIQEIILMITRKPGTGTVLTDPSNRKHAHGQCGANITWYESAAFDMITIIGPETGAWKVRLSSPEGNKIFIITDLKLKSTFSHDFFAVGEKARMDAWLEKQGMVIQEQEILDQVKFSAGIITPDNKQIQMNLTEQSGSGGGSMKTGIYFGNLGVSLSGEYRVTLKAESKTFQREKTFQFKAFETATAIAEHRSVGDSGAKQAGERAVVEWKTIFLAFGGINLGLFGAGLLAYFIYRLVLKRRTPVAKTTEQPRDAAPAQEKKPAPDKKGQQPGTAPVQEKKP